MAAESERLTTVEAQVASLLQRVAALETPRPPATVIAPATGEFDLLARMQGRHGPPYDEAEVSGAITYAGVARFAKYHYGWQMERPVPGLLGLDTVPIAATLAALGHPIRWRLLLALLRGPQNRQQLQGTLGETSTGQFYHHLKELLGAGLVTQRERNTYALAAPHVIPLLAILAATYDLTGAQGGESAGLAD